MRNFFAKLKNRKMKRKILMNNIIAACTMLYFGSTLKAQDTLRVKDSVNVKETRIVHDTVQKPAPVIHDTIREAPPKKDHELYHGEFGLRFLPTVTSLTLNNANGGTVQGDATVSYGYGIMLGLNFSKNVGIQAELNYENISQKYKDQNLDREVKINYINIPLLLSLNTNKTSCINLNVVLGPQFGINVGSSVTGSTTNNTSDLHAVIAVKQGDVGFAYGAGLDIALNSARSLHLNLGFRGVYGLVNIDGTPKDDNTYNVLIHASRKSYAGYLGLTFSF